MITVNFVSYLSCSIALANTNLSKSKNQPTGNLASSQAFGKLEQPEVIDTDFAVLKLIFVFLLGMKYNFLND
jgi:hypothetical protein